MLLNRRRWLLQALLLVAAHSAGCSRDGDGGGAQAGASTKADKAGPTWRIGVSQCNLGEPWRVQMNADIERAAAAHPDIQLILKDAQNDSLRQRAQVQELVAQGIQLLIISPKETAPLTKPVAEAYDAGIPVIVLDRKVAGDKYSVFIGADNTKIGREAGKWVREKLAGKGKLVELKGLMTSSPGQDRHNGFRAGLQLDQNPQLQVVFEADMQWLEPKARTEMDAALANQSQIDLVYAHNDPGAHGAYLAAKAAGRHEQILFVGIDALPHEGVQYVKQGILAASFAYPTGGAEAIEIAIKLLTKQPVDKNITLGTRLYTQANVAAGGQALD